MQRMFGLCSFIAFLGFVEGSRILMIPMPQGKSHRGSMFPVAKTLAKRGHEVVYFSETLNEKNTQKTPGVTEAMVNLTHTTPDQWMNLVHMNSSFFLDMQWHGDPNSIVLTIMYHNCAGIAQSFLTHQKADFLKIVSQKWDLILWDSLFTSMGHAVVQSAQQHQTPSVIFHTSAVEPMRGYHRSMGVNPVTLPPLVSNLYWDMFKFWDRLTAVLQYTATVLQEKLLINYIVNSAISSINPVDSYMNSVTKAAAQIYDYPEPLDWARPSGIDIFDVGSNCVGSSKPLPEDLEAFVNDSNSKGTVLVAFGTIVAFHTAPKHIQESFIVGLSSLKEYRVIWQYTGKNPPKLPPHIRIMNWLPQPDILAHPKTKVFVSHGGLKSFKETVCHQVPVLVMSIFGDQYRNGLEAASKGFGDFLDKKKLTPSMLAGKVRAVAENAHLRRRIRIIRAAMVDRVNPAMETGARALETIIRLKGAPKQWYRKGRNLRWFQYWCIDVIVLAIGFALFVLYVTFKLAKEAIRLCRK